MKFCLLAFLLPLLYSGPVAAEFESDAQAAIDTLQRKWYNTDTGLWNNLWWQSGNIATAIAKFGSHDESFKDHAINILSNTYEKAPNRGGANNWLNEYYDDMGWWALAWIATFDLTGDSKYLNTAKHIFEDMTGGWTTPCNGGIWWDKNHISIAAISNEVFLSTAAHLANRVQANEKQNYVNWAQAEWDWFSNSGVINSDNVINDGIDQHTCQNDGKTVFTYNQGAVLGGLAELARATGNSGQYIEAARRIANGAIAQLTDNGILTEKATLDETSEQFKGVFVRGLAALNAQSPDASFATFLKRNAESALRNAKDGEGVIGTMWQGGGESTASGHFSGIDLVVAATQANPN